MAWFRRIPRVKLWGLHGGFQLVANAITEGSIRMSESAERLTQVVQELKTEFQSLNATLETEIPTILDLLQNPPNGDLQAAVDSAVMELQALKDGVAATGQRIGGIIP